MSGQITLFDAERQIKVGETRDHMKYAIKGATWEDEEGAWLATAGWDAKVFLYRLRLPFGDGGPFLESPVASISLATNPEDLLFVQHPDLAEPLLVVSRRDSTSLHYYSLPPRTATVRSSVSAEELRYLGAQNLAPHSNAWIAFSPSRLALCPTDPTLLAVATSALPHMKLILVRLLLPSATERSTVAAVSSSQADHARTAMTVAEREDGAIVSHTSTLAPQTPYSTPQVYWRPDGSGIWVNGDDGILRGVEARSGKVVATLRDGHEAGSKVRTLWSGYVEAAGTREEWLVSGGFDRRLIVWKAQGSNDAVTRSPVSCTSVTI